MLTRLVIRCYLACANQAAGDSAEDIADLRAQEHQDGNNYDRDQNQYQRIFNHTLPFFSWQVQHRPLTPFLLSLVGTQPVLP
jgi:hypothetical protein